MGSAAQYFLRVGAALERIAQDFAAAQTSGLGCISLEWRPK
jgi:hypothetical protein